MWSSLELTCGKGAGRGTASCDLKWVRWAIGPCPTLGDSSGGGLGLVDLTPWRNWTKWPRVVLSAEGQYLAVFSYVKLGHEEKFPDFMA